MKLRRAWSKAIRFISWVRWRLRIHVAFTKWHVRRKWAPYWRCTFSRFKLRGSIVTWCFNWPGWFRVGRVIFRWEHM